MALFITFVFILFLSHAEAQAPASVREIDTTILTYGFSDPNPIPRTGKIYPYFTFDGYETEGKPVSWKMVELENDYIRVLIAPEIGGKIWGAWDKTRNEPFIYDNDVVKFRNIAMRGPWTSGGIEFNFGIIGHTPTVSTPVDYHTVKKADGSVSCYLSALDLLTRTRWVVEINLPSDKARFSTSVQWYNPSDLDQPYYTWMNVAVPAREDLHFIDPGTHYIGHNGLHHPWPVDTSRGTDLSIYQNNAFGGSKSYHIVGKRSDIFGTYYSNSDDGMIHLADRDAKPGKKVFLWALSDAGAIWERLLTDEAGQYVEVQSGRLLNQNSPSSSNTPFKQLGFSPQQLDYWTEYWFPYHGIGKVDFADSHGVWHFDHQHNSLGVSLMTLESISDTIKLWIDENVVALQPLDAQPLKPNHLMFLLRPDAITKITYGNTVILPEWSHPVALSRPLQIPDELPQEGAYHHYLLGHDFARFRQYDTALNHIRRSLSQDSFFIPALNEMALLQYRMMQYDSAFFFARRALSINTYDPMANYYYAMAADQIGQMADAFDGWEMAALSPSWRIPAWYQLAAAHFWDQDWIRCQRYLDKILKTQQNLPSAIQLQLVLNRMRQKPFDTNLANRILQYDPDNPFVAFEKFLSSGNPKDVAALQAMIRNELPDQTYLEIAIWYKTKLNRTSDAVQILELAPPTNLIDYWLAYLHKDSERKAEYLTKADAGRAEFVFPFRRESARMLEWVLTQTDHWKPRYYLALIHAHVGNQNAARELLSEIPDHTGFAGFAPLYAWRSGFHSDPTQKESDLRTALNLGPDNWRHLVNLADLLTKTERLEEGIRLLEPYYSSHPSNYQVGMNLARLYLMSDNLEKADKILGQIHVLPYEGAYEGRLLYRAVKLNLALESLESERYSQAEKHLDESQLWPENLGVGKPYDSQINTALEDTIADWIKMARSGKNISKSDLDDMHDKILKRFYEYRAEAPF